MKNKIKFFLLVATVFFLNFSPIHSIEGFNFEITEIEIIENGNKFLGKDRGKITTDSSVIIEADTFTYNKSTNILKLNGNVIIHDINRNIKIFSEETIYFKDKEIFTSEKSSRFLNTKDNLEINAEKFHYNKIKNILKVSKNVTIKDVKNDYIVNAENINYLRNSEKIFSIGKTQATVKSKYDFNSSNVELLRNESILSSNDKTKILDKNSKEYELQSFKFDINKEILQAKNINILSDTSVPKSESDHLRFKSGFFNLKDKSFIAAETEINLKKNSFDNKENDPRLKGISSKSNNQITTVKKAIFTSCKKREGKCPPWSIKAKKITHDKNKKKLIYDHAILNVYDKPVMYFPKFFHPDPSVERQTGFLRPQLNDSEILGSSLYLPYFYVISDSKDFTFKPTFFDSDIYMFQNEYRSEKKNSSLITDFSLTTGYKSSLSDKKNSISHLFSKYELDLNFSKYEKSNVNFFLEKVSNDTYLKVFDTNLMETEIKPLNPNILNTGLNLTLDHEDYNFDMGINAYENLQVQKSSDRYQYILPYYNFSKSIDLSEIGSLAFNSNGSNNLTETNNLESNIINNIDYKIIDQISKEYGFKNNFGIYFKNLNTVAKNNNKYKSSPQVELMNIIELNSSLPLGKTDNNSEYLIEPKISFRINPGDMKNYKSTKRVLNADNIFDINRLGLSDSFEAGKSLTMGINYKKNNLDDINKYFEAKISTVLRDKKENFIPESSTINNRSSNIFGSITYNKSENFKLDYDFIMDKDLDKFSLNSVSSEFNYKNFSTEVKFIEERGKIGNTNSLENNFEYKWDENNYMSFNTRRNRTIGLTEYYDLLYEYKNDCLTAGFKYKKTYYQDRDLKPKEDLLLTVTFYPLTTYEQEIDQDLYRD